jgi:HAE1 family hydrophobic/amphiphilic exporter-1
MASQFESFLHPFVIIFTLPLGAIGVVAALAVTGRSVNIVAMIGAVMLAGIVVNNAIVLVDAVNQRRRSGMGRTEALLAAGSDRLRPILMTSATTILGLLPMAIGLGEGAELRAPLAITVIGGLSVATLLTLVVIPVVYSLVDRKGEVIESVSVSEPESVVEPLTAEPLREVS